MLLYDLIGISMEPLATFHYNITCRTKELSNLSLPISNSSDHKIEWRVETDIPNFFGPSTFELDKKKKGIYKC